MCAVTNVLASPPPWDGDRIVFEYGGTYTLDSDASASGLYFNESATLDGSASLTLTAPAVVYGCGTVQVPLLGIDGICITNAWSSSRTVYPQKDGWTTIWTGAKLSLVDDIEAVFRGLYLPGKTYWPAKTVEFKRLDGGDITAQFHVCNSVGQPRAFKVEFRQNGNDIEAKVIWARHSTDPSKFGLDWDNTSGLGDYNLVFGAENICVTGFRGSTSPLVLNLPSLPSGPINFEAGKVIVDPTEDMAISSSMSGEIGRLVFRGAKTSVDDFGPIVTISPAEDNGLAQRPAIVFDGIDARLANSRQFSSAFPAYYEVVLTNNAVLTDTAAYHANRVQFKGGTIKPYGTAAGDVVLTNAIKITSGSCLHATGGDWTIGNADIEVTVDGGVLDAGNHINYLNRLVLANRGCVKGKAYVVGAYNSCMRLTTLGDGPCTIEGGICMNNPHASLAGTPYVFDTHSDLVISGGLKQNGTTAVYDILKTGSATMSIGYADITTFGVVRAGAPGALRIEEGCVLLAANDAFSRTNAVTLAGGSLDTGSSTNRLGILSLADDSSVVVGEGQITFSDSSSATWADGATLSLTGTAETLQRGHVRFLSNDGTGLSSAQLGKVSYNGNQHVRLDGDGWLRSFSPGMLLIVR